MGSCVGTARDGPRGRAGASRRVARAVRERRAVEVGGLASRRGQDVAEAARTRTRGGSSTARGSRATRQDGGPPHGPRPAPRPGLRVAPVQV